jgi:hypothetical protein
VNEVNDPSFRPRNNILHEVVPETTLHHDPVYGPGEVDVGGEEYNVLALQRRDALVHLHEVAHDLFEGSLPLTAGARARTRVGTELASLLVVQLLSMQEGGPAT